MKIDITSLCFGFKITKDNDSGTPAWATSIGQAPKGVCYIDTEREGLDNLVYGMMYKSHSDFENLQIRNVVGLDKKEEPRSDRERMMFSVFDDVYVNGIKLKGKYVLTFEREDSVSHKNRLHICYAKYLTYKGLSNKQTLLEMAQAIGCSEEACWFVSEINVKNQSQLHFTAVIVNANKSMIYSDSKVRKAAWDELLGKQLYTLPSQTFLPYITAIKSKPFLLLAGISGTGKSRIVRELAFKSCPEYLQDKDGTTPGNYCMIEVKPNWHDSTELLGYYSNMNKCYQFKKFVKFLVKAKMFPKVPFFVCLDEMNLAPVEHYFAEILSIMETRKHPKKDGTDEVDKEIIKTGVIVESQYFKGVSWKDKDGINHQKIDMSDKDWYEYFYDASTFSEGEKEQIQKYQYSRTLQAEGLTLPDNVIIIGTVNMDDTTHQFSRKVIDRAMTIEMNGGKLSNMFGGSKDLEYLPKEEQEKWQNSFRQPYVNADEVLKAHPDEEEDIVKKVPEKLENINKALKGTPFEVSYRVLNELTIMVGVLLDNKKEGEDIDVVINQALDRILLMKILPRIEGDSDMFNLSKEFKQKNDVKYNNRLEWLMDLAPEITIDEQEGDDHRQTAREKIKEMIERLENQEFTRFWP